MIQAYPPAAPVLGDLLAKNLDWPEADEVARRLHALLPPQLQAAAGGQAGGNPLASPVVQQTAAKAVAAITGLQQRNAALGQQLVALSQDKTAENRKLEIDAFRAQTERLKTVAEASRPSAVGRS
jgi:hypothetical protein